MTNTDISIHILEIAQNALAAGASLVHVEVVETADSVSFTVTDDGVGMTKDEAVNALLVGYSTKNSSGFGIPNCKSAAESADGEFSIESGIGHGTCVRASFMKRAEVTLGDIAETFAALMCAERDADIVFTHTADGREVCAVDTRQWRTLLGSVPLSTPVVVSFAKDYIRERET